MRKTRFSIYWKGWISLLRSIGVFFLISAFLVLPHTAGLGFSTEQGAVPIVQAVEIEKITPVFHPAEDGPGLKPNHPPIDQIPPMPMPVGREDRPSEGRGALVVHNSATGETITFPNDAVLSGGSDQGGGYPGADGGGGTEEIPATFNVMYEKNNTGDHPWRMNAKLVMRFGNRWSVCSGTMRDAEVVLTAGHCVYDNYVNGAGWADEIWVYPGWDGQGGVPGPNTVDEYGWGKSTKLGSWESWTNSGDWDYDVGLVAVDRAVGILTGWFGFSYGKSCSWHTSTTYHNASYPAQDCGQPGLHNGRDMYYWVGNFDSCPGNRLQVDTAGGCFNAIWGGMSGSGAYYIEDDTRYVHAVASTSDRSTYGRYARQWEDWVNWTNGTFIPADYARGSSFDLQALDANAQPATIPAGDSTTLLNHLATNPTNGSSSGTWYFDVYLSTNDFISSYDTLLSSQQYSYSFGNMSSVRVNMAQVTIPSNTPEGDYWIGLEYDSATDGNSGNNNTEGWDSVPITVTDDTPPTPDPMTWNTTPYATDSSIAMTATTASDPNGVQYYFDETTGHAGGTDSGWQSSTSYADSVNPSTQYCYRVKARDTSSNYNETGWSSTECFYSGTSAVFRVSQTGNVFADGGYYCGAGYPGCLNSGSADIAEAIQVTEPVEASDVVALDPNHPGRYRKAREPYSTLASGVISTKPAFRLGISKSDFMNQSVNMDPFLNAPLKFESNSLTTLSLSSKPNKPYELNKLHESNNSVIDSKQRIVFPISKIPYYLTLNPNSQILDPKINFGHWTLDLGLEPYLLNPNSQILDPKMTLNFEPFSTLTLPSFEELLFHQYIAQKLSGKPLLALMGVVPVKATTENGPIQPGDLLTTSSVPGYVMACEDKTKCAGAIVGKALESLNNGEGIIKMLVMR